MIAFDKEANSYDSWYTTKQGKLVDEVETKLFMKLLQAKKGMHILDIGCGTGNYSIKLAKLGCKVTAVDISQNMLDIAKGKSAKSGLEINFQIGTSNKLNFVDNLFDAVVSITAIEFFTEVQKSINEMFRITKNGGSVVIGTINKESAWGKQYESAYFKENTVFKYAKLISKSELGSYRKNKLADIQESLFFAPDIPAERLNMDLEKSLINKNRGGFICGLWKK